MWPVGPYNVPKVGYVALLFLVVQPKSFPFLIVL